MEAVDIYLEDSLQKSAQAGEHNFLNLVSSVLLDAGLSAEFRLFTDVGDARWSLSHMKAPRGENGLVFRRANHYPFWQIDPSEKRWDWDVASAEFLPGQVDGKDARRFRNFWRERLFPELLPTAGTYAYVPLQGMLIRHRSFQSCSPITMLETVLGEFPGAVVAALHPKEHYTGAEIEAVEKALARRPDASLVMGEMDAYLPGCKLVITQNSSVAFNGYFFDKPAILFGDIDFHHIATKATPATFAAALNSATNSRPNYAKYLWWYWQIQSINAGRENAREKIRARFEKFGWPVA